MEETLVGNSVLKKKKNGPPLQAASGALRAVCVKKKTFPNNEQKVTIIHEY